ncbi:multimerin-2 isoform X2 [Xenopus laevis]|uniref:Multimerin-2 isoform X2 n=1 Tax=Xenopus laevis TaxID=8355 RepID=A0A8J1L8E1_XENLA|nr:multimerin-2 isoform X2 [Xenopus laevis]
MAGKLCVFICFTGLIYLVTPSASRYHYDAGLSPIGAKLEVHGVSSYPHGLPGHTDKLDSKGVLDQGLTDVPSTVPSEGSKADVHDAKEPYPTNGNRCPYVHSRIVSFAHLCKTEKYVIRSQTNCPPDTPDCQRIMYRLAQKPVYETKRKEVTSLEWKCCPGYVGTNCEVIDPNSIQIPESQAARSETEREPLLNPDTEDRLLRDVFLPYVENFLREQFNPMWDSFNKSLQNLSDMVNNLSENVESNRKRMDMFLENTLPKKDLHELGTKFESKIQENIVKLDHMKHELYNQLHFQQTGIHYNFTVIKADTDMKLKRSQKLQQSQFAHLNISMDELRRGQDQIQDQLQSLAQNISELSVSCRTGGEETTQITSEQINQTLTEYKGQIRDLYTESDAAFENLSTLEKWFKELRTEFKKNAHEVQISLMEKSLIMEENKDILLKQIIELNSTIGSLQGGNDDLWKDCDCQKITMDILTLEEGQNNLSSLLKNVSYGIEDVKEKEGSSKTSLQNSVEDLSLALHLNRQSLSAQQEQGRTLARITSQLESRSKNFSEDVEFLKKDNDVINNHIKLLDSTFSSLLEDATRHDRALQALLGEDVLEVMSEDDPVVLQMSLLEIYDVVNETRHRLENQQLITDLLNSRLQVLEIQPQKRDSPDISTIFNVEQQTEGIPNYGHFSDFKQPNSDDHLDESMYSDIAILKNDIRNLNVKLTAIESQVTEGNYCINDTIVNVLKPYNISLGSMRSDVFTLRELFTDHVQTFQKIFSNYETLIATNTTLNVAKIQAFVDKKMKKKQNEGVIQKTKKELEHHWQSDGARRLAVKHDSSVAFAAGFTEGAEGVKIISFNKIFLNYGNVLSPEDGVFYAPYNGVYAFSITVDFSPGNALSYLILGGRQKVILYNSSKEENESVKDSFVVVELQKDDKVWLELLQGSIKKNSSGTLLAGYLIFKT